MRICVPIPCFYGGMPFTDAIRKVRELGFDAVETYNWKSLDLDAVRAACEENGVELMSMCTTEFNMTNPDMREKWLAGLKESCEAANRVGAKRLITQVGQDTGAPRAQQHAAIAIQSASTRLRIRKNFFMFILRSYCTDFYCQKQFAFGYAIK